MKKTFLILLLLSALGNANGQPLESKNAVIELGMGFPPLFQQNTFGTFGTSGSTEVQNIGTFILSTEILLTDRIGFAVVGMYSYSQRTESLTFSQFDESQGFSTLVDYDKIRTVNSFQLLFGPNFHLYRTLNLDTYLGLGFGINKQFSNTKFTQQPPVSADDNPFLDELFTIPVAFRISYGLRYFVNDAWAIKAEFGLGGPLINLSLTRKVF